MTTRRSAPADLRRLLQFVVRQLPVLIAADAVYVTVRAVTEGSPPEARANAGRLLAMERSLGIDWEEGFQRAVLPHEGLVHLFNGVYVWMYWPFVFAALAILFVIDTVRYTRVRNTIFLAGAIGMVMFATLPVAPPRFMPGYVGTVSEAAREHFVRGAPHWVNRYAALPSFHAGWTLVVSVVLATACRSRPAKALALVPGVLMGLAVVATGNHYIVDVVVGDAICVGAYLGLVRWHGRDVVIPATVGPAG